MSDERQVGVLRPFYTKEGETFYEVVTVNENDVSEDDELLMGETETEESSLPAFAINRSDFVRLLRGEELMYGPLRRMISIQDGPFDIVEDGTAPHKIVPPEPIEFRGEPEAQTEYVYAKVREEMMRDDPTLNERIGNVLKGFVAKVRDVFRGGAGSGHHAHAGRPGEVGGSAPSGVATAEPSLPFMPKKEAFRTKDGKVYFLNTEREQLFKKWRRDNPDLIKTAMDEVEFYHPEKGFGAGQPFVRECPALNIWDYGRSFGRFFIFPDGRLLLVKDHDELSDDVYQNELLHEYRGAFSYLARQDQDISYIGKNIIVNLGFIRGSWQQSDGSPSPETIERLIFQFDTPVSSAARRTIKDMLAINPNVNITWEHGTGDQRVAGQSPDDLKILISRVLDEEQTEDDMKAVVRGPLRRIFIEEGGEGSGHHGHAGRPGEVGGSAPEKFSKGQRVTYTTSEGEKMEGFIDEGAAEKDGKTVYGFAPDIDPHQTKFSAGYWGYENQFEESTSTPSKPKKKRKKRDSRSQAEREADAWNDSQAATILDILSSMNEKLDYGDLPVGVQDEMIAERDRLEGKLYDYGWELDEAARDRDAREYKKIERKRNLKKSAKEARDQAEESLRKRGGEGSGYTKEKGHKGRIGEVGGSVPSGDPSGLPKTKKIAAGREEAAEKKRLTKHDEAVEEVEGEGGEDLLPQAMEVYPVESGEGERVRNDYSPSNQQFQFNDNLDNVGQIPSEDITAFLANLPTDTRTMTADQRWDLLKVMLDMPAEKLFELQGKLDAMPRLMDLEKDTSTPAWKLNNGRQIEGMRDVTRAATTYLSYMQNAGIYFEQDRDAFAESLINAAESGLAYDLYGVTHWSDNDKRGYSYKQPDALTEQSMVGRGGEGSGHKDHKGRLGEVGGSLPSGASARKKQRRNLTNPPRGGKTLATANEVDIENTLDALKKFDLEELREMQDEASAGMKSGADTEHFQKLQDLLAQAVDHVAFGDEPMPEEDEGPEVSATLITVGDEVIMFDSEEQYNQIKTLATEQNSVAIEREPELTSLITKLAADNGGDMSGLEHSVKSEDGIIRKIREKMVEDDVDIDTASEMLFDQNRYTMLFTPETYTDQVKAVQKGLEAQGWKQYDSKWKNFWGNGGVYEGYNTAMINESGERFELQFHTYESIAVKVRSHEIYTKLRTTPESQPTVRKGYIEEMREVWASANLTMPLNFEQLSGVVK